MVSISYSNFSSFISKLNELTGLSFNFPTRDQWYYAAKGGKHSLGFKYSGSDNPGDVAWYSSNCTSIQNVKQKSPNELGIYDMSGNVYEMVLKYSGKKESTTYYYWELYGGSYLSAEDAIVTSRYSETVN